MNCCVYDRGNDNPKMEMWATDFYHEAVFLFFSSIQTNVSKVRLVGRIVWCLFINWEIQLSVSLCIQGIRHRWLRVTTVYGNMKSVPEGDFYKRNKEGDKLTALPASKKLAVVWSPGVGMVGISRLPSAMPTMAVMWVSVPKTCIGTPRELPEIQ